MTRVSYESQRVFDKEFLLGLLAGNHFGLFTVNMNIVSKSDLSDVIKLFFSFMMGRHSYKDEHIAMLFSRCLDRRNMPVGALANVLSYEAVRRTITNYIDPDEDEHGLVMKAVFRNSEIFPLDFFIRCGYRFSLDCMVGAKKEYAKKVVVKYPIFTAYYTYYLLYNNDDEMVEHRDQIMIERSMTELMFSICRPEIITQVLRSQVRMASSQQAFNHITGKGIDHHRAVIAAGYPLGMLDSHLVSVYGEVIFTPPCHNVDDPRLVIIGMKKLSVEYVKTCVEMGIEFNTEYYKQNAREEILAYLLDIGRVTMRELLIGKTLNHFPSNVFNGEYMNDPQMYLDVYNHYKKKYRNCKRGSYFFNQNIQQILTLLENPLPLLEAALKCRNSKFTQAFVLAYKNAGNPIPDRLLRAVEAKISNKRIADDYSGTGTLSNKKSRTQ
jgi:hypothetical protein